MTDTDKVLLELKSAAEWFKKHGKNTNTAIIGICERAAGEIKRQQAKIEKLENIERFATKTIKKQEAEIERLMPFGCQVEVSKKIEQAIKTEAIKEFAERLCEDRVSNDPVVIAVKVELELMEEGENDKR